MDKQKEHGFTLIELLVVIAIIGVLASVILSSVSKAKDKATDAAIKSQLHLAQPQVGIYAQNHNNSYLNVCADPTINAFIQASADKLGTGKNIEGNSVAFSYSLTGGSGDIVCHDSASGWATVVSLKSPKTANAGWCVDSNGTSIETTTLAANAVVCP